MKNNYYKILLFLFLLLAFSVKAQLDTRIDFTEEELEWVNNNPVIYYSDDVSWEPFVRLNRNEKLEGIAPDFLKIIERKTGLQFEFVKSSKWAQVIERLKNRDINLVLAAIYAPERDEFAYFTESYFSSPLAIVTGRQFSYIKDMNELSGKKVTAPKGYYSVSLLKNNYPGIELIEVDTLEEALNLVNQGKADAYLDYLPVMVYKLKLSQYSNLKISGTLNEEIGVSMMIAKEDKPLVSIINKTLKTFSSEERRAIQDRWFNVAVESGINPVTFWQILTTSITLFSLILLWVFKLRKEVKLRKLSETNLILAREEAEKASKAKSEFLANMSHEIRTPMNAVFGYSQLLEETNLNEDQQYYLEAIKVGSSSLLHIINDILEISKIEAGKMTVEFSPVNIRQLVLEVEQLFSDSIKDKKLEFITRIHPEAPSSFISDGNRIRQILINLVGNALKFTNNGKIEISVENFDNHSKELAIAVKDTGIGIAKDRFESIFDYFEYQVDPADKHIASSGLGLSICKKIADKLNAEIQVQSDLGKGSEFRLILKNVEVTEHQEITEEVSEESNFLPCKILIVDDVKSNRIILEKYLSNYPFEILQAENGKVAVDLVEAHSPEVVLMDVRMPVMDGFEATKIIKNKYPDIKVIAVTASALESEDSQTRNQVFDAFLRKPILKVKIINMLEKFAVKKSHQ